MSKQPQRGQIPIAAAERLSDQYHCPMVVIYAIEKSGERFTITTYGATRPLCRHAADIGRQFAEAVLNSKVAPALKEPSDVPAEPAVFESVEADPPITDAALCRLSQIFHASRQVNTLQYPDSLIARWIESQIRSLRNRAD